MLEHQGELDLSFGGRISAATDNSIFWQLPEGIYYPINQEDCQNFVLKVKSNALGSTHLTPRGGFTGTNGQSLNQGYIIDCSKHLRRITRTPEGVLAEPGVVLDQLNDFLKDSGNFFAPHVSTSSRATLGGMFGTNAAGKGSLKYGRTQSHIQKVKWLFPEGQITWIQRMNLSEFDEFSHHNELQEFRNWVFQELIPGYERITQDWPQHPRGLSGYNLKDFWNPITQELDLIALLAGSEGTLGMALEFQIIETPLPHQPVLSLFPFESLAESQDALKQLLQTQPIAVELVDQRIIRKARHLWPEMPQEFQVALEQAEYLFLMESNEQETCYEGPQLQIIEASQQKQWWQIRSQGVELLSKSKSRARPIAFAEDTVVPPESLPQYLSDLSQLLDKYQLEYSLFGHADVGCVHMRPFFNLQLNSNQHKMKQFEEEVFQLVKSYQGSFWGEHGRGYRTQFVERSFSQPALEALKSIKQLLDPKGYWNPHKILDSSFQPELEAPRYSGIEESTQENWHGVIQCNGNASCLNHHSQQAMCPSFAVTHDRRYSPKGRALMAREWLLNPTAELRQDVHESLELCLSCHACTQKCPLEVNIPEFKSMFYHQNTSLWQKTKHLLFAQSEKLSHWLHQSNLLQKIYLGLSWLPLLNSQNPGIWKQLKALSHEQSDLVLYKDPLTYLQNPAKLILAQQITSLLELKVKWLAPINSGKLLYKYGLYQKWTSAMKPWKKLQPKTILTVEPSLEMSFNWEYPQWMKHQNEYTTELPKMENLTYWILKNVRLLQPLRSYHEVWLHCHQRESVHFYQKLWDDFLGVSPSSIKIVKPSCCGQAGEWGYLKPTLSQKVFAKNWGNFSTSNFTSGTSCQCISSQQLGGEVRSDLDLLWEILQSTPFEVNRQKE